MNHFSMFKINKKIGQIFYRITIFMDALPLMKTVTSARANSISTIR